MHNEQQLTLELLHQTTVANSTTPHRSLLKIGLDSVEHFTLHDELYAKDGKGWLKMYLPARSAQVLRMVKPQPESKAKKRGTAKKEDKATVAKKSASAKKNRTKKEEK